MKSIFELPGVNCIQIEAETALGLSEKCCRPGPLPEECPEDDMVFGEKMVNISFLISRKGTVYNTTKCI
jgi:hypothetical protein